MVFGLRSDVGDRGSDLRHANAECSVALLPSEETVLGKCVMHLFRGGSFDKLDRLGNGQGRGDRKEQVNVVLYTADRQCFGSIVAGDTAHERPETVLKIGADERATAFRAKDAVKKGMNVCVGHDDLLPVQSSLRDEDMRWWSSYPAINRWAIFNRPYGSPDEVPNRRNCTTM